MNTCKRTITRRGFAALGTAAVTTPLLPARSFAADPVVFRTNWQFYGSHGIFFLGVQKGYYNADQIACDIKSGNGSGAVTRLVANKDSTFAYASATTMMQLAAQGAPVMSIATIDAQGTDSVLVNPASGIKTFKDLEGKRVLTTAGAGVNTLFPVACKNAGVDISKIELTSVSENALVPSYLRGLAPAILGGMDDKPAEIEANGGKTPIIFNYADYGVAQPGYAIVAHKDTVANQADLCKRFVAATIQAVQEAKGPSGGSSQRSGRSPRDQAGQDRADPGAEGPGCDSLDPLFEGEHRPSARAQCPSRLGIGSRPAGELRATEDDDAAGGLLHEPVRSEVCLRDLRGE